MKVHDPELWKDSTWVERSAEDTINGITDSDWRIYPDADVLAFIHMKNNGKVPILWIDGKCFYYSEAMKHIKKHLSSNKLKHKLEPIVMGAQSEIKHAV